MQTITIDIINNNALRLLKDLELLKLIKLHNESSYSLTDGSTSKFKGAMSKQTHSEIDNQLKELRGYGNKLPLGY